MYHILFCVSIMLIVVLFFVFLFYLFFCNVVITNDVSNLARLCENGCSYKSSYKSFPAFLISVDSISVSVAVSAECRLHPRSADSAMLVVPSTRRSTLGDRAFPVASARAWNSLPSSVRNAPSLTTFRRELKTVLFRSSFDND